MAVVHQSSATASGTGAAITLAKPAGVVAGDVLIASFFHAGSVSAVPSGWTLLINGGGGTLHSAYWKLAGGSEPASYTWTQSGPSSEWRGGLSRFSGVDNTTPIDVAAVAASSFDGTTVTFFSGVTTTTANAMVVGSVSSVAGTATASSPPGALTERWDANGVELASGIQPTAGATGALTWTFPSNASGGWLSALQDANPNLTVTSPAFPASTAAVYAPTISTGTTVVADFIPSGATVFQPALSTTSGPQNVTPNFIPGGSTVFTPSLIVPLAGPTRVTTTHTHAVRVAVAHEQAS